MRFSNLLGLPMRQLYGIVLDIAYGVRYSGVMIKRILFSLLVIQVGLMGFGCFVARYADSQIGANMVVIAFVLSTILWAVLALFMLLLGQVADLGDDALIEVVRVASSPFSGEPIKIKEIIKDGRIKELFEFMSGGIAAIMLIDIWVWFFGAWSNMAAMGAFIGMAIWFIFAVIGWGGPKIWLPRLQRVAMVLVGVIMFGITVMLLTPGSLGQWLARWQSERAQAEQALRGYQTASHGLNKDREELVEKKALIIRGSVKNSDAEKDLRDVNADIAKTDKALATADTSFDYDSPEERAVEAAKEVLANSTGSISGGLSGNSMWWWLLVGFLAFTAYRFVTMKEERVFFGIVIVAGLFVLVLDII